MTASEAFRLPLLKSLSVCTPLYTVADLGQSDWQQPQSQPEPPGQSPWQQPQAQPAALGQSTWQQPQAQPAALGQSPWQQPQSQLAAPGQSTWQQPQSQPAALGQSPWQQPQSQPAAQGQSTWQQPQSQPEPPGQSAWQQPQLQPEPVGQSPWQQPQSQPAAPGQSSWQQPEIQPEPVGQSPWQQPQSQPKAALKSPWQQPQKPKTHGKLPQSQSTALDQSPWQQPQSQPAALGQSPWQQPQSQPAALGQSPWQQPQSQPAASGQSPWQQPQSQPNTLGQSQWQQPQPESAVSQPSGNLLQGQVQTNVAPTLGDVLQQEQNIAQPSPSTAISGGTQGGFDPAAAMQTLGLSNQQQTVGGTPNIMNFLMNIMPSQGNTIYPQQQPGFYPNSFAGNDPAPLTLVTSIDTMTEQFLELFPYRMESAVKNINCSLWRTVSQFHFLTDDEILNSVRDCSPLLRACKFDYKTKMLAIEVPADSSYHNLEGIRTIQQNLKLIASVDTKHYAYGDNWYLYLFFTDWVNAIGLEKQMQSFLESQGFEVGTGKLNLFPSKFPLPLPLQVGFAWLSDGCQIKVLREEVSFESALALFFSDVSKASVDPVTFVLSLTQALTGEIVTRPSIGLPETVPISETVDHFFGDIAESEHISNTSFEDEGTELHRESA